MNANPVRGFGARYVGDKAAKADRTETAFQKERDRVRAANDEKTARLRTLRLAKENRAKESGERAAPGQDPVPAKKPRGKTARELRPALEPVSS